jgi:hypothetical protein
MQAPERERMDGLYLKTSSGKIFGQEEELENEKDRSEGENLLEINVR